jgi:hypothetical protein
MPKNKYQRRRTLREPTFPLPNNNEPFQGAIQQPTNPSTDLGREDARQIREGNNPNTRYVDKPSPTTSKNALRDAAARQQAMQRNAQRQVLGERVIPQVQPRGRFVAPSVPSSPLAFKGGSVHYQPTMRGNLLTAVVGVATDMLVQPIGDAVFDNVLSPLTEALTGAPAMTMEEIRRQEELRITNEQEVALMDAENERIYQQRLEDAAAPIREGEAPDAPILPPMPSETLVDDSQSVARHIPKAHSQSSSEDSRNREYLIRRAALGDNPTQEEMDAVRDYGLEQHRKIFMQCDWLDQS